jgi:hypothetical protein
VLDVDRRLPAPRAADRTLHAVNGSSNDQVVATLIESVPPESSGMGPAEGKVLLSVRMTKQAMAARPYRFAPLQSACWS